MELRILRYFLAVAREENITRAAHTLNITQPTLSRQLMQLEDELSAQLFYREKNKILLTEEGMLLRKRAEELVELADRTEKEFSQQEKVISGEIYLGAGEVASMKVLAAEMKKFHDQYPLVRFHMHSGTGDDIKEKIERGLIDIALLVEPINIEKFEYIQLKEKYKYGIIVKKDNPLALKEYVTKEDLVNESLILSKRTPVQDMFQHWFGEMYEKINIISTFNLLYNASIMVEEGLGIALTIEKIAYNSQESNVKFVPLYPTLETGTVLAWKKQQVNTITKTKFIEHLKSTLND